MNDQSIKPRTMVKIPMDYIYNEKRNKYVYLDIEEDFVTVDGCPVAVTEIYLVSDYGEIMEMCCSGHGLWQTLKDLDDEVYAVCS